MKKAILFAAALTLAVAPAAMADAIFYAWGSCQGEIASAPNVTFTCDGTPQTSFITYQLTNPTAGVVALSGGIDITIIGSPDVPTFWHMEGGGCNATGLGIDDARTGSTCTNANGLATFTASGGTQTDAFITAYGVPFGGPNKARLLWSVVRASSNPAALAAGKHFAGKLNFFDDNALENGGTCVGCLAPVSQVLNWVLLESAFQNASGDAVAAYIPSDAVGSQPGVCVNANGCDIVPVKNRTWGVLKSLYR